MKLTISICVKDADHPFCPFRHEVSADAETLASESQETHIAHTYQTLINLQAEAIEKNFAFNFQTAKAALQKHRADQHQLKNLIKEGLDD